MKKGYLCAALLAALFAVFSASLFAGAAKETNGLGAIRKAGVLRVGIKSDVPGLGLYNLSTKRYEGFEVELARLIARAIFGDRNKAVFTPITAGNREALLDSGEVDLLIATFTITGERKQRYFFSTPYYTDAVSLMVHRDSPISSFEDFNGKVIGVAGGTTGKKVLVDEAEKGGLNIRIVEFASYPEIKAAQYTGKVDVFSGDRSILAGYLDHDSKILGERFSPQDYGIASRLDNPALAAYVDNLIKTWLDDGTIGKLIRDFNL